MPDTDRFLVTCTHLNTQHCVSDIPGFPIPTLAVIYTNHTRLPDDFSHLIDIHHQPQAITCQIHVGVRLPTHGVIYTRESSPDRYSLQTTGDYLSDTRSFPLTYTGGNIQQRVFLKKVRAFLQVICNFKIHACHTLSKNRLNVYWNTDSP